MFAFCFGSVVYVLLANPLRTCLILKWLRAHSSCEILVMHQRKIPHLKLYINVYIKSSRVVGTFWVKIGSLAFSVIFALLFSDIQEGLFKGANFSH